MALQCLTLLFGVASACSLWRLWAQAWISSMRISESRAALCLIISCSFCDVAISFAADRANFGCGKAQQTLEGT